MMPSYVDLETQEIVSHGFLSKKHATYKRVAFTADELADINAAPLTEPQIAGDVKTGKAVQVGSDWVREYRPYTQEELDTQAKQVQEELKLTGVLFEGVMCSATAQDMWGLASIKDYIAAGNSTNFHFDNGNVLLITPENLVAFQSVWQPFRQSFFQ